MHAKDQTGISKNKRKELPWDKPVHIIHFKILKFKFLEYPKTGHTALTKSARNF